MEGPTLRREKRAPFYFDRVQVEQLGFYRVTIVQLRANPLKANTPFQSVYRPEHVRSLSCGLWFAITGRSRFGY